MMIPSIFGENLFDGFFDGFARPAVNAVRNSSQSLVMRTDVKELKDSYELVIDIPGIDKENIKAELKNGYLTVNAVRENKSEEKDGEGKYIRRERYYGSAQRSFYVGEDVQKEDIKAKFDNGTLKLSIPKNVEHAIEKKDNFIEIEG